ncbi:MAG: hypothetical protein B0D92_05820 [Spirochaeta sp. LUC14_002_19_P3]|nr:MAG: hypothetical protein B0D92_05820 [Spirochaeta sp. LUC14_002_19_P3]
MNISFQLNGKQVQADIMPHLRCTEVLRETFHCFSLRCRCDNSDCGSCMILVDKNPVYACLMAAFELQNHEVWTIEGISEQDGFHDIVAGFHRANAQLCIHCAPARALATQALLEQSLNPTWKQLTDTAMSVNCGCTSLPCIIRAITCAARERARRQNAK